MILDGKELADVLVQHLKSEIETGVKNGWHKPKLVIFTVEPTEEINSFIRSKKALAEKAGADVEIISYDVAPRYIEFANRVAEVAHEEDTTGVIIQLPLPASLSTTTLLDYVPPLKEIEGFKKKPLFEHPIGLAVLCLIKKALSPDPMTDAASVTLSEKDIVFFKNIMKRKKVVLLGRGRTGGEPIGNTLSRYKANYINIRKSTPDPDDFIKQASIIISAVGKNVINPEALRHDAVLIGVGIHKVNGMWKGDYDENVIKDRVLAYSPTPGGVGPLNVAYLLYNLVQAWKMQHGPQVGVPKPYHRTEGN